MKQFLSKLTFWKVTAAVILLAGASATAIRFFGGLGAATNLSDEFPWGLWIGFDVLCGVGLAAGGFTLAAIVYIFNVKRFEPIIRPTILTAFLGYLLVIVALMFDLGRPLQIWHAFIMWNPRSVMFEVAWCVILYTAVLSLEFAPVVLEKFNMTKTIKVMKKVTIPLIITGVLLSTLHQSSLGSLYLIVPEKLYGLWYSTSLPIFFFVSAVSVGCAMMILESFLSSRAFNRGLEMNLLTEIGRVAVLVLGVLLTMKIVDLADRHAFSLLMQPRMETYLYWFEISIGVLIPLVLLAIRKVRENQNGLFLSAVMIIIGFILNRMNIAITGMEGWAGVSYFPTWMEITVTLSIVVGGFVIFSLAAKYLSLFKHEEHEKSSQPINEWIEDLRTVSQGN
ncbi:MAG: Ni/Fe-hydrogenase cytochrome b subunit [Ignavibacteriales bacterium]|nr:Ni/Fe-hydrogenase cytochrome b subunit [Ignavibacteriales bacterium]